MPNYKEMTQEEAVELWEAGVHNMEYSPQLDLYVEGEKIEWVPFVPTPYFWETPYQHYAELWRVAVE